MKKRAFTNCGWVHGKRLLPEHGELCPCKSNSVHIQVEGSIAAPSTVAAWGGCGILCWLCFSNVNGLVLDGSGQIDGRGSLWWNHGQQCKIPEKGGSGHARRITFEQITLHEAGNPIIIDQHYCDGKKEGCPDQPKAVAVSDVSFTGVRGTSSDEQAITLDCAAIGCNNIRMVRVAISSSVAGKRSTAFCRNAHGTSVSTEPAVPCLSGRAFAGKFLTQ
ncbi:hypothetical protein OIU76_008783 [Salix suchowensis]|nr:hypothetical protein OIU76_008783 [Salix suchowensis]